MVKYQAFDRQRGDYRAKRERGFASEDDAIAWWILQKQNRHRPVAKAEAVKAAPLTLDAFLDRWLKSSATTLSAAALATCEKPLACGFVRRLGTCCFPIWNALQTLSNRRKHLG